MFVSLVWLGGDVPGAEADWSEKGGGQEGEEARLLLKADQIF